MCNTFYNICVYVILTCLLFVFCCLDQLLLELRERLIQNEICVGLNPNCSSPSKLTTHKTTQNAHHIHTDTESPHKHTHTYPSDLIY